MGLLSLRNCKRVRLQAGASPEDAATLAARHAKWAWIVGRMSASGPDVQLC